MPTPDVRVSLNHKGIGQMLKSREVAEVLRPYAERVLAAAVADPHDNTGDYESGLEIVEDKTDRVVLRVVGTDWKSNILEANFGILARALGAAK